MNPQSSRRSFVRNVGLGSLGAMAAGGMLGNAEAQKPTPGKGIIISSSFDIRNYGAVGDGVTDCTAALQKAIDLCSDSGGGTVVVAAGKYLFYPVQLKSGVHLEVMADAVLLAGTDPGLYPEVKPNPYWNVGFALRNNRRYVFYAEGAENIAICGRGKIDFQGMSFINVDPNIKPGRGRWKRFSDTKVPGRSILFVGCRDVRLEDITLVNTAGGWFTWFLDCEHLRVRGVTMRTDLRTPNSDGIHLGSCRDVIISDCELYTGDDAIIIRSMQEQFSKLKPSENITITNCVIHTGDLSAAILIGWTHDYAIRNCVLSNLVITGCSPVIGILAPDLAYSQFKDPPRFPDTPEVPPITPLQVENIQISNINATSPGTLLQIDLDKDTPIDYIRGISIRGVQAVCSKYPIIKVLPQHHVSDIEFCDVTMELVPDPDDPKWTPGDFFDFQNVENVFFHNFRFKRTRRG